MILAAALIVAAAAGPPPIVERHIPMPATRKREMRAYSKRHYGKARLKLTPKVIVEHIAVAPTAQSVINTFAPDHPDPELHELPNVCSHYLISENSKILALDVAEKTVAAMQDARLVVIPRATHNVHSDNPADFARELDTFLTEVLPK